MNEVNGRKKTTRKRGSDSASIDSVNSGLTISEVDMNREFIFAKVRDMSPKILISLTTYKISIMNLILLR
jgi:hypothetical protein